MRIRIQLFTWMRIRILLLIKVMGIWDHWSIDPPRLPSRPPLWAFNTDLVKNKAALIKIMKKILKENVRKTYGNCFKLYYFGWLKDTFYKLISGPDPKRLFRFWIRIRPKVSELNVSGPGSATLVAGPAYWQRGGGKGVGVEPSRTTARKLGPL